MKWLRISDWSIRAKLAIAFLLAALIPMALTAYLNVQSSLKSVQKTETEKLALLARSTANQLDQLLVYDQYAVQQIAGNVTVVQLLNDDVRSAQAELATLDNDLKAVAKKADGNDDNTGKAALAQPRLERLFSQNSRYLEVSQTLQKILESNQTYEFVYLLDGAGRPIIERKAQSLESILGLRLKSRKYFQEAYTNGKPYIDALVGKSTKKLGFYFSYPVTNPAGERVGVAVIKIKGDAVTDIVNTFKVGESGYAFLVDQDGVVVSHPDPTWYYQSFTALDAQTSIQVGERFGLKNCDATACTVQSLGLTSVAQTIKNRAFDTPVEYVLPVSQTLQIASLAPTSQLGWVVGVNESKQEFSAPVTRLLNQSLIIVVVVGLIVAMLALLLARSIASPIRKLAHAAQDVEADRPFDPLSIADVAAKGDEVGHLAGVFSDMVVSLRARMTELRTIYEIGTTISSSVDLDKTLDYIITTIKTVIPYDAAEICLYDKSTNSMVRHVAAGAKLNGLPHERQTYPVDESYLRLLLSQRSGVLVPDTRRFVDLKLRSSDTWQGSRPLSYLGIPLLFNNVVIGTIELLSTRPDGFNNDNLRMLESIAIQAAVVVHNAQEVQQRESKLQAQISELRIEIDSTRRAKQVEEIVSTDFFQDLMQKASKARNRAKRSSTSINEQSAAEPPTE